VNVTDEPEPVEPLPSRPMHDDQRAGDLPVGYLAQLTEKRVVVKKRRFPFGFAA